jgi:hypothetical protein
MLEEIGYIKGCFLSLKENMTKIETAIALLNATAVRNWL